MNTIPRPQLVLGYKEFFKVSPPLDRLSLVSGVCKRNLIVELAGLNYRLKPKTSKYHDTSLENQIKELKYFCGIDDGLYQRYSKVADYYTVNKNDYPLIFIRQTCIYALEEIIQSDLAVIEDFKMARVEVWDSIFKYILAVNTSITEIENAENGDLINFETLNPKMLPLNELNISADSIYTPYRGYRLLEYLSKNEDLKEELVKYFESTYSVTYDYFVYETLGMYLANKSENSQLDFYYIVTSRSTGLFEKLSQVHKSTDIPKLLSIKKYPFYKSKDNTYILTDNTLLLEKTYTQFINDFWFDWIKKSTSADGKYKIDIKKYKSIIGYFFESYVRETIQHSFSKAKYYTIKLFEDLKIAKKGGVVELADLYIRDNTKIILGQVKATSIYDNEKYGGSIDTFYKNDRNKFFDSFGVDQLVSSIMQLDDDMPKIDANFPSNKVYRVYPIIIVNEKALQTPLMGKIFQDRFLELMKEYKNSKTHIFPLSIIHIGDLESIQDYLFDKYKEVWDLLKFHCRNPHFMPPFYNSINRKDIRANYERSMVLYEDLIDKHNTT
jgi:hypothetical protein